MNDIKRLLITSDIHGDIDSLNKALDIVDNHDAHICLGDLVGEHTSPASLRTMLNVCDMVVWGNHECDAYSNNESLRSVLEEYKNKFVIRQAYGSVLLYHGKPDDVRGYVEDIDDVVGVVRYDQSYQLALGGHRHYPGLYHVTRKSIESLDIPYPHAAIQLLKGHHYVGVVPSISQPRRSSHTGCCELVIEHPGTHKQQTTLIFHSLDAV